MVRTALISVYNKDGIVDFARDLIDLGWNILASGGTHAALTSADVPAQNITAIVGKPILGHRVVTLSREIHAAILARNTPQDQAELEELGIPRIDLVCVDLYPLEETIKQHSPHAEVIEKTDIGGPTLLRAAAKGGRIVIAEPETRMGVLGWLKDHEPDREEILRFLAARAELVVARYCYTSAKYLANRERSWPNFPNVEVGA